MPKGDWGHKTYGYRPESQRIFPELEQTPDLSRGEIRFATEVLLATIDGTAVPMTVLTRARQIARVMARG